MPCEFEPLGDQILVELEALQTKTEGGILLPGEEGHSNNLAQYKGTIIAMGPNAFTEYGGKDLWADVGDTVLFSKYDGSYIFPSKEDGEEHVGYRVMTDACIRARKIRRSNNE